MVKNNTKPCVEGRSRATELSDLTRNIDQLMLKVKHLELMLEKDRFDFSRFQQDVEIGWKTVHLAQTTMEKSFREKLKICATEYASKLSTKRLEYDVQKESMRMEAKSLGCRSKYIRDMRYSGRSGIYDSCFQAKKECLEQLEKYDNDVGRLHSCKNILLIERDFIAKQRLAVQDKLVAQRALYNQLRKERELNAKEAFSMKFQYFRRNRAARIIQRNWRFYLVRASWKKKKIKK